MALRHQKPLKIENLFAPRSPLEFLGYSVVTAIIGLVSAGNPVGLIGVPAMAALWWWIDRQRIKNQPPTDLTLSLEKQPPAGARGLILLLSPYSPQRSDLKNPQKLQPLVDFLLDMPVGAMKEDNFKDVDLFNSNLVPQIKAVEYHIYHKQLRNVWLIASQTENSKLAARILKKYLEFLYSSKPNIMLEIHCGQRFEVVEHDYAGLYWLANHIFQTCGYRDDVIVADVTGGTKMMSVALAMACVPPQRRMQYMDSQRDWQGNPLPKGQISPVGIDVDPILNNQ